ncbi:MAG: hypothetical protein ACK4N5_17645, partial [Myxococcales bacterium]
LARFLGMRSFSKDLLEFGHNQNWDSSPYGGDAWVYSARQPQLWGEIVDRAKAHGLALLPYYEYAGSIGGALSYGKQRRCRPLGDRTNLRYTDVTWSEIACIDLTEPEALADVKKVLDATVTRFKDRGDFAGVWFRHRASNWPISFTDATLARFGAQANGNVTPTREQLKNDAALLKRYYAWWFDRRRDFLVAIRDHLRTSVHPDVAVLLTPYMEEALRFPTYADWATPTDDLPTWNPIHTQPGPWQWRFSPTDWTGFVEAGKFTELMLRMTPPDAQTLQNRWPEKDHAVPPADPSRYVATAGVHMTLPFSRLYTVGSAAGLEAFRAQDGLALVRHYNLNEEDGQNTGSAEGPMSKRVGYFVSDVDRAGPYGMLAEARAFANGDPRYLGYLSGHSFNRGFPDVVQAFNAAFLSLPAVPSARATAPGEPEVVVRHYEAAGRHWFGVVNTSMAAKTAVRIPVGAGFDRLRNLVTGAELAISGGEVTLDFYPGQLYALAPAQPSPDAGVPPAGDGGPTTDGAVGEGVNAGADGEHDGG